MGAAPWPGRASPWRAVPGGGGRRRGGVGARGCGEERLGLRGVEGLRQAAAERRGCVRAAAERRLGLRRRWLEESEGWGGGANGGNCARGRGSWNRQVLGVAHFAEMRHQVDPYAWRILAK